VADTEPAPARLSFDGSLTVRTIAPLRDAILHAFASHAAIEVDCAGAESVDLAFIQLLIAARRSAVASGKAFGLAAPAAGALRVALEQGGFLPHGGDLFWDATG